MPVTRVFNDFKRRFLAGEVPRVMDCTAYLLNSGYEASYKMPLYARTLYDFASINSGAINVDDRYNIVYGSAFANGTYIENTYFRDTELASEDEETGQLIVINENNIDSYRNVLSDVNGNLDPKYEEYLKKYSSFFLVGRSDEFAQLVAYCKSRELETFAVVLYDDVENVNITNSCFGTSKQHPFRGLFDGNGFSISIQTITLQNSYACGLFGYIAETGIVKNLKIYAQKTDLSQIKSVDNYNSIQINVNDSINLISLETIKNGCDDVCIGVLAGVNNGLIENVVVSADVLYNSKIRPDVYLVQNKANQTNGTTKLLVSQDIIDAGIVDDFANTTALSSFGNFCYPTQLCLNSYANIIPYVGYFNEGMFNTSADIVANMFLEPLYRAGAIDQRLTGTVVEIKDFEIAEDEDKPINQMCTQDQYMNDIYQQYIATHTGNDSYNKMYSYLFGANRDGTTRTMSFRLGPNSKQAFLIGGVVGYNNGDIKSLATSERMLFKNNVVALIGGIAGRGNRGQIEDTHIRTVMSGSSAMYDDILVVSNNVGDTNRIFSCSFNNAHISNKTSNVSEIYNSDGERFVNSTISVNSLIGNMALECSARVTPYGTFYIKEGESEEQIDTYTQYFDYTATFTDKASGQTVSANVSITTNGVSHNQPVVITAAKIEDLCNIQYNAVNNTSQILNTNKVYSACVYEHGVPVLTGGTETIISNMPSVTFYFKAADQPITEGTFSLPISSLTVQGTIQNPNTANFYQMTDEFNVKLSPVFNIGGMFGEYLYADGQNIVNSDVYVGIQNFICDSDTDNVNRYKNANKCASFACNMTFDSSNKSNSDLYASYDFTSANARIKNKLEVAVYDILSQAGEDEDYKYWHSTTPTSIVNQNGFIQYINCYNQIAPGLVTTQYADAMHHKGVDRYANVGIQYTDSLFFRYGINHGYEKAIGNTSRAELAKQLAYEPQSGVYFNYPSQSGAYNKRDANSTYNARMCQYDTVFEEAYDHINTEEGRRTADAYVTNQLTLYPQHYPLYRGRAALQTGGNIDGYPTFANDAYHAVGISYNALFTRANNMARYAVDLAETLDSMKPVSRPNYIYAYSAVPMLLSTRLSLPCTLMFSDCFSGDIAQYHHNYTSEYAKLTMQQTNNKCYALSSDSCEKIYSDNRYCYEQIAKNESYELGIPAMLDPNFVTPSTEDIVVDGTIVAGQGHIVCKVPFQIQDGSRYDFGNLIPYVKTARVSNYHVKVSHIGRIVEDTTTHFKRLLHYDSKTIINYDDTDNLLHVNDIKIDEDMSKLKNSQETERCVDDVAYFTLSVLYNTIDSSNIEEKYLLSAKIIPSVVDDNKKIFVNAETNRPLTVNSLVYSYVPTHEQITQILDEGPNAILTCTGLSADDLQYMLLVDSEKRPIMDVKLDVTAADNDGYVINFDEIGYNTVDSQLKPHFELSGGLAINIETGN